VAPDVRATREDGSPHAKRDVIKQLRDAITEANLPDAVDWALMRLLDDARGDIDAFRHNLEAWFDDTMARVSGWYKRKAQLILVLIGVVTALALNANTLVIGERLWKDTALRAAVVQQATATTGSDGTTTKSPSDAAKAVDEVAKLGVPIGWTSDPTDPRYVRTSGHNWLWHLLYQHVLGWLLTVVAISFGAPFWFDTLSRFSRLRSSGKPEQPLPASAFGKPGERVASQSP
jgi:hypothetical protein